MTTTPNTLEVAFMRLDRDGCPSIFYAIPAADVASFQTAFGAVARCTKVPAEALPGVAEIVAPVLAEQVEGPPPQGMSPSAHYGLHIGTAQSGRWTDWPVKLLGDPPPVPQAHPKG
jgi:hypothetical protein